MLKKFIRLTNPLYRQYTKSSLTLEEVMQYKQKKNPAPFQDKWFDEDKAEIGRIAKTKFDNKRYHRIQNDWKNNLIKKQKIRERRIEKQQQMVPKEVEEPKFIIHRYLNTSILNHNNNSG